MDLKQKRKLELENQKDQRKSEVILAAIALFKEKGIENTKMSDIAESAEVGVASVYRYFSTKTELAIAVAISLWQDEISTFYNEFETESYKKLKGRERVKKILELYVVIYKEHKGFMRFLEEFDNFIIKNKVTSDKLYGYEKKIINLMPIMIEALELGKKDGTVSKAVNSKKFYITIMHTLISLCQKLILRNNILESDYNVHSEEQIELVIDMALKYIEN